MLATLWVASGPYALDPLDDVLQVGTPAREASVTESESSTAEATYREASAWYGEHWDPARPLGEWWDMLVDAG